MLRGAALSGPLTCDVLGGGAGGKAPTLKALALSGNKRVGGRLDACFTASPALEELQLDGTAIEGALPPLAPGAALRYLYLGAAAPGEGRLAGSIPASYGGAASPLHHLHLRNHALEGALPAPLPPGLQLLDVAHNRLSGPFPEIGGGASGGAPSALDFVDVSHNRLTGALPADLDARAPALDHLDASANAFTGRADAVAFPASLVFADLSDNSLEGQLWESTSGWASLQELRVAGNAIAGARRRRGQGVWISLQIVWSVDRFAQRQYRPRLT